jgi:hypothetical protein
MMATAFSRDTCVVDATRPRFAAEPGRQSFVVVAALPTAVQGERTVCDPSTNSTVLGDLEDLDAGVRAF